MKLFRKLSLFVAVICAVVAIAPAMPNVHAANSFVFINNDTIDYLGINIAYVSDVELAGAHGIIVPDDPLHVNEVATVPITGAFEEDFNLIFIDDNGTSFIFTNFDKSLASLNVTFEILFDATHQMVLKVSAPGYEPVTYTPDAII